MPAITERPYALANPISLVTDKPREDFTRADLLRFFEERRLERITLHYTALDGKYKELRIPITSRLQAERLLADGERVDGSSLFKGLVDTTLSDLYVVPIYKTAFLNPFDEPSLEFTCRYLTRDGELVPFAPDTILHKAAALFRRSTGAVLWALGELEFFLLSDPAAELYPLPRQCGYHATAPFVKSGAALDEMTRLLAHITGAVKYAHSEVGCIDSVRSELAEINGKRAEQVEIEFLPTPIEDAADDLVLARWLIRNVAYRHGRVATFAPKIEEGVAGNGMHIHMEVRRDGRNAMLTGGELSEEAHRVIGGLCTYAPSLTAFGNSTASSYLRLVPNQEAPTRICWSDLNRNALVRVPLGWANLEDLGAALNPQQDTRFHDPEPRQTVELRTPDGSAIVHLLLAGIAMAAEWGLTHEEAREVARRLYVTGNILENAQLRDSLPPLPRNCAESARLVCAKRAYYERSGVFAPGVLDYVSALLTAEHDESLAADLKALSAGERQRTVRNIMHNALHRH